MMPAKLEYMCNAKICQWSFNSNKEKIVSLNFEKFDYEAIICGNEAVTVGWEI